MSLKLNERYPARFNNPSADYPQGSFKNRTTPTAKDGSYLEQDWANDKEGFFQSLLSSAGLSANGLVDKVGASQYLDAMLQMSQMQKGKSFTTGGTSTVLTLTPSPAIQAYTSSLRFSVTFSVSSGISPTLNISAKGAKLLKQYDPSGAKVDAQFVAGQISDVIYDGTDCILLDPLMVANFSHGQCRLAKSGATLKLSPLNGNRLLINGVVQTIPSAGVTLAPAGLAAPATMYVYAYMASGVMTLEASTTGHSTDAATGVEIKTGDATRTLVGMARTIVGPAFQDTAAQRFVISHFNRVDVSGAGIFLSTFSTASATYVELSSTVRCEFLTWGNEPVNAALSGSVTSLVSGTSLMYCGISFDGGAVSDGVAIASSTIANYTSPANPTAPPQFLAEGYHFVTVMGKTTNSQTISVLGAASSPDRGALFTSIRG